MFKKIKDLSLKLLPKYLGVPDNVVEKIKRSISMKWHS